MPESGPSTGPSVAPRPATAAGRALEGAVERAGEPMGLEFGSYYYSHDCGETAYEHSDQWLGFFDIVARWIVEELHPESVLDAGCAMGFLVERLRARGVEAWGIDVSEYAIANVDESVREFCRVVSITDPPTRRYDLVTCIEVIEHLPPRDAPAAVATLCAASDRVLFSSSPFDYGEPTHVNVRQPEDWSALFASHGMLRNVAFDASPLTPWAALYERTDQRVPEVVRSYERALGRLAEETRQLRETVLRQQARLAELDDLPLERRNEQLRGELAAAIEHGQALEAELEESRRLFASKSGRAFRAYHDARRTLRGPR